MPNFNDIFSEPEYENVEKPKTIVEGSFSCQECQEVADEAEYVREKQIIFWKCPNGHISSTGFKL